MASMTMQQTFPPWLLQDVPDPCTPLSPYLAERGVSKGRRWENSTVRRSRILATTRHLMAERSVEDVHLQSVSENCGLAVQTIYNIVGNRAQLIGESAAEWVMALAAAARRDAEARDLNVIFALLTMFWSSAFVHSAYVRSAVHGADGNDGNLRRSFRRSGIAILLAELSRIRSEGAIREAIDLPALARQLRATADMTICDWMTENYAAAGFARDLVNGPGLMLAAALRGSELRKLERGLSDIAV